MAKAREIKESDTRRFSASVSVDACFFSLTIADGTYFERSGATARTATTTVPELEPRPLAALGRPGSSGPHEIRRQPPEPAAEAKRHLAVATRAAIAASARWGRAGRVCSNP